MTEYTATTTDLTNTLSVTTEAEDAEVLIEYNESDTTRKTVELEWWASENEVTIAVSNQGNEKMYTVVVEQL